MIFSGTPDRIFRYFYPFKLNYHTYQYQPLGKIAIRGYVDP